VTLDEFKRTVNVPDEDSDRATALLERASDVVRRYTGQTFTRVVDDTVTLRVDRGKLVLPQRPAEKPTRILNADGGVLPPSAWWWGGLGIVEFGAPTWVANGPAYARAPRVVTVTYTHGYEDEDIPGDVQSIVCDVANRVYSSPASGPGLRSEGIDDYRYDMGGGVVTGALALVPSEMVILDRYRSRTGAVRLR